MDPGKVTGNALKRSVLGTIAYRRREVLTGAGLGRDCAIFEVPQGGVAVSCLQEAEILENRDMDFLIGRCANSLAASGGVPLALMLGLTLPESLEEPQLKSLMARADEVCGMYGMQIAGGHTAVSGVSERVFASAAAFGVRTGEKLPGASPGQDIVLSKWIGLEGTAVLAGRYAESLNERFPVYLTREAAGFGKYMSVLREAAAAVESGVCYMHDASEGGIFAALWEMAEGAGIGLTIDLKKIPIRQETVEICEFLGLNPYELQSGGCLIMTSADGEGLVRALARVKVPAVVAGRITEGNKRLILNGDGVRYMDRPHMDSLFAAQGGTCAV